MTPAVVVFCVLVVAEMLLTYLIGRNEDGSSDSAARDAGYFGRRL